MSAPRRPRWIVDVRVEDRQGFIVLRPETERGRLWLEQHVESESWQWFGGRLAVDGWSRADVIIDALGEDGLVVVVEGPGVGERGAVLLLVAFL